MTDLLDAGALIGFMQDEPGAGEVETTLRRGESFMNAANLAEVVFVLTRRTRLPAGELRDRIGRQRGPPVVSGRTGTIGVSRALRSRMMKTIYCESCMTRHRCSGRPAGARG